MVLSFSLSAKVLGRCLMVRNAAGPTLYKLYHGMAAVAGLMTLDGAVVTPTAVASTATASLVLFVNSLEYR